MLIAQILSGGTVLKKKQYLIIETQLFLQFCQVYLSQLSNISHGGFCPCKVIYPIKLLDVKSYKNYPDVKRFSKHTNMSIKSTTMRKPLYEGY